METFENIQFDGSKLKQARAKRPMRQIAAQVGISRQALWQIENGKSAPSADVLLRLCAALDLDVAHLRK